MGGVAGVLITGAGGQLGRELVAAFGPSAVGCERHVLDVADRDQVLQVAGQVRPHTIVHAAAWTDVDGCEADPDLAFAVNALGTRHVAEAARLIGARVCYLSSDYVFDGTAERPYTEWDEPRPLSVYGRSKLAGERELSPGDTVVRTSWLSGLHGRSYVKAVLARASAGEKLQVIDDQFGCPTFADDLAGLIRWLVVARRPGVFHVTNQGAASRYEFARDIVAAAGLDPDVVTPVSTAELRPPRLAPRPAFSVLDNAALRLSGIPLLPDYHEPLRRLVKELVERQP